MVVVAVPVPVAHKRFQGHCTRRLDLAAIVDDGYDFEKKNWLIITG